MDTTLSDLLLLVLTLAFTALSGVGVKVLVKVIGVQTLKTIEQELINKQDLVNIAIRFVEQVYKDYKGEQKFEEALKWVLEQADEHGIKITENEAKGLIEAAVKAANETWKKEVYGPTSSDAN